MKKMHKSLSLNRYWEPHALGRSKCPSCGKSQSEARGMEKTACKRGHGA